MEMLQVLQAAAAHGASDVHIVVGMPPVVRIEGDMVPMKAPAIEPQDAERMIYAILSEKQRSKFEQDHELDCSIGLKGVGRFRVNVLQQKNGMGAVLRVIKAEPPDPEAIGLPEVIIRLSELERGLVLVTGPTGSGKSTTLSAMVERINRNRPCHILTVEDPIEFTYTNKRAVVTQREVGTHTLSFQAALRAALRQDPDIILVGEMRDLETIQLALSAAETGHMVFGTLHTTDAAATVDRIIDVFPSYQQEQIRAQLSTSLKGVVCQQLLKKIGGGRVAAREILLVNSAVSNLIREGKTFQIYNAVELGRKVGMISLDRHMAELVVQRKVKLEEAMAKANDPTGFRKALEALTAAAAGGQR